MKPRILLAIFAIPLALIIAAVPENTTHAFKLTASQLLEEANSGVQYYSPDEIADMIINKDPSLQLIDVRNADEFEKFNLPGAMNIPLADILSKDWQGYLDQDGRINIFYSNGTLKSDKSWMITRQLGYENNYVLLGGLNYWVETIMNPSAPKNTSPNEEFAKYDFRKGAGKALGGSAGAVGESTTSTKLPMPMIKSKPKKKRVQGGC
ncbi:MAG: rhodanese-like domain-containing protein [Bacteroidales bacterium]|nr:rhodanese-like domain-containing protein [Bacteroidales bacterium]